ncbi:hypothetical protein Pta02_73320 [Planobispora takensis]|uniref:Uncharacterized protein n=1 Tax=Planobispora takensis TaxID=1367882 RepID=A0A8J3T2X6_9ACTN|nr:hypothetical protein Pta02_73320 [Planobispora takensis]
MGNPDQPDPTAGATARQSFKAELIRLKRGSPQTYESLAEITYLSDSSVHRYFTGETLPSSADVVRKLAVALGGGPDGLVSRHMAAKGGRGDPERQTVGLPPGAGPADGRGI